MKIKKFLLVFTLFTFFIISTLNVYGSVNWWTEGNEGAVYGNGGNYWLYASPYVSSDDNTNFTTISNNFGTQDLRINALLNDYNSANYIYYFDGGNLYCKDIYGDTKTSYLFGYNINEFSFINYENDGDLEILVRYDTNRFSIIEMDSNFLFTQTNSFIIDNYYFNEFNIDFEDNYLIYIDSILGDEISIGKYDINTDTLLNTSYTLDHTITSIADIVLDSSNNKFYVMYYIGSYDYSMVGFDVYEDTLSQINDVDDITLGGSGVSAGYLRIVKLGSAYSQNVITYNARTATGTSRIYFYSLDLSKLYQGDDLNNGLLKPIISDMDLDSKNEFCIRDVFASGYPAWSYYCYDENFVLKYYFPLAVTTQVETVFANYDNSNDYLEVIFPNGVYELQLLNATSGEMQLNAVNTMSDLAITADAEIYPVILLNKAEYVKDLIIASDTTTYIYLASGTPSICGDGVCDFGESMVTCASDCLESIDYTFNITNVLINPTINGIWQNGTTYQIDYTIEPSDQNVKYQTQVSISYNNGVNYTSIDDYSNINEKTKEFSFTSTANQLTETGKIKIDVKVYSRNATEFKYYDFIVRERGLVFGESVYSEVASEETLKQDNVIYTSLTLLGSMLNLSVTILFLIITLTIMISILYYSRQPEHFFAGVGSSILVGFITLIIGVLTGCVNVGLIITISIIGIIALIIGFKNQLTGARG